MKRIVCCIVLAVSIVSVLNAQHTKNGVTVKYPQMELSAYPQPSVVDGPSLPFLMGRMEKGKREQFGIVFGGNASAAPLIEFLDASGNVLKAISVNDLLGIGARAGVSLLRKSVDEAAMRAEAVYAVHFPSGDNELTIRSIAASETQGGKRRIVLSFSVKEPLRDLASVRMTLPVDAPAAAQENGFIISAKTQSGSLAAAVFPKPLTVAVEKKSVVLHCSVPHAAEGHSETPLLWLIAEGVAAQTAAGTKTEAVAAVNKNAHYGAEPNLVVVTSASKQNTQPADTVTLSVVCTNIGFGNATEVVLSNPIPAGTVYVEGSAIGQGTEITIERSAAAAPQRGVATEVKWKLQDPLPPGAEKIVRFKVIVQ